MKNLFFTLAILSSSLLPAVAQTPQGISHLLREQKSWQMRQLPANSVLMKHQQGQYNTSQYFLDGVANAAISWLSKGKPMPVIELPMAPRTSEEVSPFMQASHRNFEVASNNFAYQSPRLETSFMRWLSSYQPKIGQ